MVYALALATFSLSSWRVQSGTPQPWIGHSGDAQHTGISLTSSQDLTRIKWSTPVDENPRYNGNSLLTHYGVPIVTSSNILITGVKTGLTDGFKIVGYRADTGRKVWTESTDYSVPSVSWIPSFSPTLVTIDRPYKTVAYPMGAGRVAFRSAETSRSDAKPIAFYGNSVFNANKTDLLGKIKICTPLTACPDGSVIFGFNAASGNAANLVSGVAKVSPKGTPVWIPATTLSGDTAVGSVKQNAAIALSADGTKFYVPISTGNFGRGVLVRGNLSNLQPINRMALKDPKSGNDAAIDFQGTASPSVGLDGDVYCGVLENPFPGNGYRGWLLHFNADLSQTKTPAAFGWDDTATLVPSFVIPDYSGPSTYLLFIKYNNYAVGGGQGLNELAIVDPGQTQVDPRSGTTTMKVIRKILNPTTDPEYNATYANAVREWCVNSAVLDLSRGCILVTGEDGILYQWHLASNSFTQRLPLTTGIGQAYTPTSIAPDGTVFAIANARLYAVGN